MQIMSRAYLTYPVFDANDVLFDSIIVGIVGSREILVCPEAKARTISIRQGRARSASPHIVDFMPNWYLIYVYLRLNIISCDSRDSDVLQSVSDQ